MDPERRGNIITRFLGIETFRHIRNNSLRRGWGFAEPELYAACVTIFHYALPLSQPARWLKEGANVPSWRKVVACMGIDAFSILSVAYLGPVPKVAYNLGVEVAKEIQKFTPPSSGGLDY